MCACIIQVVAHFVIQNYFNSQLLQETSEAFWKKSCCGCLKAMFMNDCWTINQFKTVLASKIKYLPTYEIEGLYIGESWSEKSDSESEGGL